MTMDDVDRRSKSRFKKSTFLVSSSFVIMIGVWFFSTKILAYESARNGSAAAASCADVRYLAKALASDFTSRADFESSGHQAGITLKQAKGWRKTASELLAHRWTTCPVPIVPVTRTKITVNAKGTP